MKVKDILFDPVYMENKKKLEELASRVSGSEREREWVLCLGAGVSISAGLPDWYGLLAKMTAQIMPSENSYGFRSVKRAKERKDVLGTGPIHRSHGDKMLQKQEAAFRQGVEWFFQKMDSDEIFLKKQHDAQQGNYKKVFSSINVLESAEYIRNYIEASLVTENEHNKDRDTVQQEINWHMRHFIRESCIGNSLFKYDGGEKERKMALEKLETSALGAVARLLKDKNDSLIHEVITYNYDNLLESYLREVSGCERQAVRSLVKGAPLHTTYTEKGERWNIAHVHGRIPIFDYEGEEMSEEVILTESDYYNEEHVNYSWTNTIQSYVIGSADMIFVGFSGTDYNFRRLIKYVDRDRTNPCKRYIFFSVDDIVNAVIGNIKKTGETIDTYVMMMSENSDEIAYEKLMVNYLIHAQTIYWGKHGIQVVWSSHEELPRDLDSLHSS